MTHAGFHLTLPSVRARAVAALALVFGCIALPGEAEAQTVVLPEVAPTHEASLYRRVEREIHAALLADDDSRGRHIEAAEQLARHLVEADSASAEAHYWLSMALGVKTEYSGPFQKLTSGQEVFFTTARVLELDPEHAGGHEMMGRLHAAVMRLPWLVRGIAMRMGMGRVLGEASWEEAESYYRRAADLDPQAIAPRLELAKLLVQQERDDEAGRILEPTTRLPARSVVDERMLDEARTLLVGLTVAAEAAEGSP